MFTITTWVRKAEGMSDEAFLAYWLGPHAMLVRRVYTRLQRYVVRRVVGTLPRGEAPFDGLAELTWASREEFDADVRSPEVREILADLGRFTRASGTVVLEEQVVLPG
jgi:uncharacterized protein (TIGR02118 family)